MPPAMTAGGGRQLGKLLGLWLDVMAGTWFDTGMSTTTTPATRYSYAVETSHGRRTRCTSERGARKALGRLLDQEGATAVVTYHGLPIIHAVGTSLGWRAA